MSEVVIQVENLSKLYRLGTLGTGSLRQDMQRWWAKSIRRKEDPFFQSLSPDDKGLPAKDFFWALQAINFEIRQGEVWGIIGHNGAGKSTLLKILSRIVRPTSGVVYGKGKISSLLEVGTGFNPELTGRENIYLSGYILGMKKGEIRKRFDEIVDFSGVEKFLDTPVKRYSSGMYMRLAFAVAAHLEPDILIVDEVLAVGDAEFQKKCMGKMHEASSTHGRTILFVSHNLQAINNLCSNTIWLDQGKIKEKGETSLVMNTYLTSVNQDNGKHSWNKLEHAPGNEMIRLKSIQVKPYMYGFDGIITVNTPIQVNVEFWNSFTDGTIEVSTRLYTVSGVCVFDLGSPTIKAEKGILALSMVIPGNLLNDTSYSISLIILKDNSDTIHEFPHCATFDVEDMRENMQFFGVWPGVIRPQLDISFALIERVEENK
jgi:lipopolysaccharide transport system ATP-binding protein